MQQNPRYTPLRCYSVAWATALVVSRRDSANCEIWSEICKKNLQKLSRDSLPDGLTLTIPREFAASFLLATALTNRKGAHLEYLCCQVYKGHQYWKTWSCFWTVTQNLILLTMLLSFYVLLVNTIYIKLECFKQPQISTFFVLNCNISLILFPRSLQTKKLFWHPRYTKNCYVKKILTNELYTVKISGHFPCTKCHCWLFLFIMFLF